MKIFLRTACHVTALLLLGVAAFFPDLGQEIRVDFREARHAEIARNMVESGAYAVPYVNGTPYIDKPPLFNWTIAALFRATNRVDFTIARLPSAVSAIAVALGIYILGKRWLNARTAFFAAMIWTTSLMVVDWACLSRMDMLMTCLLLYGVVLADVAAAHGRGWMQTGTWCGACAVIGAAILSKGPVPLLFFLPTVVALWRARRQGWIPPLWLLLVGLGIIAAMIAAWAISVEIRDPGHLERLLGYQFGEGVKQHTNRLTMYLEQLLIRTIPWGFFAAAGVYWAIGQFKRSGYDSSLVPALIAGSALVVMSLVPNKRPHYLLPMLPMWSLFLGAAIDWAVVPREENQDKLRQRAWQIPNWAFLWPLRIILVMMLAVLAALWVYWIGNAYERKTAGAVVVAALVPIAVVGTLAAWRSQVLRAVTMLFVLLSVLAVAAYPILMHGLFKPTEETLSIEQATKAIPRGVPVAAYDVKNEYLFFKLNLPVVFPQGPAQLASFLAGAGPRYLIVRTDKVEEATGLVSRPVRQVGTYGLREYKVTVLEVGLAGASRRREADLLRSI